MTNNNISKQQNPGKKFEEDFAKSASDNFIIERQKDSASYFTTSKNPYDFRIYKYPHIYFLELKSTGNASISLQENIIPKHQIEELYKRSRHKGVYAGFLLNFRERNLKTKHVPAQTYFVDINYFMELKEKYKSINPSMLDHRAILLNGKKKITRHTYDIDTLLKDIKKRGTVH